MQELTQKALKDLRGGMNAALKRRRTRVTSIQVTEDWDGVMNLWCRDIKMSLILKTGLHLTYIIYYSIIQKYTEYIYLKWLSCSQLNPQ